jgi:ABC-type phosphate/phosphonate transport system substrate-binding protein
MFGAKGQARCILVLAVGLVATAWAIAAEKQGEDSDPVRIGMVGTLFRNTPEPVALAMMQPFGALMETQTGLSGKIIQGGDALHLGKLLAEDKVQLGVFHGIEFGWARQKFPDLKPLMIAVNQQRHLRAMVMVRNDCPLTSFSDLRGKMVTIPKQNREHCRIFLDRRCQDLHEEPGRFFGQTSMPPNAEVALDDVVDGQVAAAIMDAVALECYQRRKPARFAQLKPLERSEIFPAAVVAYHPGAMEEGTLRRFRDGMLQANKSVLGSQLMTLWKLTAFEPIPADYEQTLENILKTYPAKAVVPAQ